MRRIIHTAVIGAAAVALALGPTVAATATTHPASTAKHFTLSVTGNGKDASVVYIALTGTSASAKGVHIVKSAHIPWTKHVTAKADLYEVVATAKHGTRIGCTIRDDHGKLRSTSTAYGSHGIATCIVAKSALLAGVGGTGGSGGGTPAS